MQKTKKVSIIGAGMVGATIAQRVLESDLADIVLLDIAKNIAIGKACDLSDAAPIVGHERTILGTDDYRDIASSDIVVVTAGLARKPGMTREDLIVKNARIVKDISENVKKYAPGSIVIIVTNPLDAMTYLAYKTTDFNREKVFGMAGVLDAARFVYLIADELKVARSSVKTYMLGSHGDTMVPVISKTSISGRPVSEFMSKDKLDKIIAKARKRGAEIVNLLGSGSSYYSPSAAVFKAIDIILRDKKETIVASVCLSGEYGLNNIAIGVPCRMGKNGIEKVVELELSQEEGAAFSKSAKAIKGSIDIL
ncbi:MAG: malate dehydrogenase [Candidatus Omnitrophota bacterium]